MASPGTVPIVSAHFCSLYRSPLFLMQIRQTLRLSRDARISAAPDDDDEAECHLCRVAGNTVIPYGMWVPVAVWQPREQLYTCYFVTLPEATRFQFLNNRLFRWFKRKYTPNHGVFLCYCEICMSYFLWASISTTRQQCIARFAPGTPGTTDSLAFAVI